LKKFSKLEGGSESVETQAVSLSTQSPMMRVGNAGQMLLTKKRFEKVEIWFISNVSEGEGQERGYIGVEQ